MILKKLLWKKTNDLLVTILHFQNIYFSVDLFVFMDVFIRPGSQGHRSLSWLLLDKGAVLTS